MGYRPTRQDWANTAKKTEWPYILTQNNLQTDQKIEHWHQENQTRNQKEKIKNNEYEFAKLTAYQNDEPNQNQAKLNLHPAKRALAGFASQIQKHAVRGMFLANWTAAALGF